MAHLHELLAVEGSLDETMKAVIAETVTTFSKRADHFLAHERILKMFDASRSGEEGSGAEHKSMVDTVPSKLAYTWESVARYYDALLQKEAANQDARADIVVEGVVIATAVPATFLLVLEKKLVALREVYKAIPTLAPGVEWEPDPSAGEHVYRTSHPERSLRTEKTIKPMVLVQPTKEHPAQVKEIADTVAVGEFVTTRWCSMVSPARKSELLGRIDALTIAVRQARMRANSVEVKPLSLSRKLFEFIHK